MRKTTKKSKTVLSHGRFVPAPTKQQRAARADRFASVFRHAAGLAEDHITERALNVHDLVDSTSGDQFGDLVSAIDPKLTKRRAAVMNRLRGALPIAKHSLVEEYEEFVIEEQDANRQAAYLIGVCVGMRIAGGAK